MPDQPAKRDVYYPHKRKGLSFEGIPSLCHQSFQAECDVNGIMKKFEKTGLLDHVNEHHGDYGNYIGFDDYHASLNSIRAAEDAFNSIPAKIRAKFDNDPAQFLLFVQDDDNHDEIVAMGLANAGPEDGPRETKPLPREETPKKPGKAAHAAPEGEEPPE